MNRFRRRLPVAALVLLPLLSGCLVAAAGAAGAGAAAGIYLSDRGASSLVEGSIVSVHRRTQAVLQELRIEIDETRSASDGSRVEYRGHTAELDVVVELEEAGPSTTQVNVTARRSAVEWDRAYARTVVQRIVDQR